MDATTGVPRAKIRGWKVKLDTTDETLLWELVNGSSTSEAAKPSEWLTVMKWFDEKEFACRCCGQLPPQARENVRAMVREVLDPVRSALGKPITVNSGYRCPKHNKEVGGVAASQHLCLNGSAAADIACGDNQMLVRMIVKQGRFDQVIVYPTFIHVSYKRNGGNRHQAMKKVGKGYEPYNLFTTTRPSLPKEGTYPQPNLPPTSGEGLAENRGDRRFPEFWYRSQSLCPNGRAMDCLSAGAMMGSREGGAV